MRARRASRSKLVPSLVMVLVMLGACGPEFDATRMTPERGSFGEIVYQESCERVAWTGQLDEQAAGLRSTLDVSGALYDPVCANNMPAPSDAPVRLVALQAQRSTLVRVVDQVLPQNFLSSLQAFLEAIEVLDDDGTMEATMTSVGSLLQTMIDDPGFAPALARIAGRIGYRPAKLAAGLAHATLGWPGIDDLLESALTLLLDDKSRPGPELAALLQALSHELGSVRPLDNPADPKRTLRVALDLLLSPARDVAAGKPYLSVLRDARGMAQVAADGNGVLPAPFADKNGDGLADIDDHGRFVGSDAKPLLIGAPFLPPAGVDPAMQKRDAAGRLLGAGGQPAFRYLDLDGTVLAGLLREQVTLADPMKDDLIGLLHGAGGLLGARVARTRDYRDAQGRASTLSYKGFAVENAALLDLAHAYIQILGAPRARDLLTGAGTLLDKYEDPTSRALAAMLDVSTRGGKFPNAQIPATSTLYDELIPIIVRIVSVPGLTEDLLSALVVTDKETRVLGLAPMIAQQMLYKDRFVLNQSSDPDKQTPSGSYQTLVDHGSPDADWNRSVMQRMMHLVHDANGVEFCNKQGAQVKVGFLPLATYDRCKMFQIDDLGLFFALTIADRSIVDDVSRPETRNMASFREHLQSAALKGLITDGPGGDNIIESLTGITGFQRFPTPKAAARSLFLDQAHQSAFMQNSIDPVQCGDGDRFIDVHADSIFAWEATLANNPSGHPGDNFYDAVKPLINAFAKHDECLSYDGNKSCTQKRNAAKIFLDLLSVLHVHWGSPKSTYFGHQFQSADSKAARFSTGDAALTYEPLLGEVLSASDLVPSIINFAPVLNTVNIDGGGGLALRPVLIDTLRYVFDPAAAPPGLTYRDGSIKTTFSDGKTPGPRVTPYYLLADAYAKKRLALLSSPDRAGSWRSATSDLVDDALTVSTNMAGAHLLKNRRLHGVTLALVSFLNGRLAAHVAAKDLDAWIHKTLVQDLTDAVGGPTMAALVDVAAKLEFDPATLRSVYGLLQTLADESQSGAFPTGLSAIADVLQILLDDVNLAPIAHTLGSTLDPARLSDLLRLMKRSRALDPRVPDGKQHSTLGTVLANFYQVTPSGAPPMSDLADALAEINRAVPGKGGDLDATDYRTIFGQVQGFLTDEQRGFIKFVHVVQNRRAPTN